MVYFRVEKRILMQLDFNFVRVKTGSNDTLEGYLKIYTSSSQKRLQDFLGRELPQFEKIELTKKEIEYLWNSAQKGEFVQYSFQYGIDYKQNTFL